jgi:glycerophosphoryl diester phosphodiesterase
LNRERRSFTLLAAATALVGSGRAAALSPAPLAPARAPVEVMGHRGACALWPEHTLASYAQAIRDGADYIEPDLVCTRDGVLVARHENKLSETTDVAQHPAFANRRQRKTIDGVTEEGWYVEDFSLDELKRLRAVERIPQVRPGNAQHDGQFQIPTWDEIIDFCAAESAVQKRPIGLIPELKHSKTGLWTWCWPTPTPAPSRWKCSRSRWPICGICASAWAAAPTCV